MEQRDEMETRMDAATEERELIFHECDDCKITGTGDKNGDMNLVNENALLHETVNRLERTERRLRAESENRRRVILGLRHTIDRLERTIIGNAIVIGSLTERNESLRRELAEGDGEA